MKALAALLLALSLCACHANFEEDRVWIALEGYTPSHVAGTEAVLGR